MMRRETMLCEQDQLSSIVEPVNQYRAGLNDLQTSEHDLSSEHYEPQAAYRRNSQGPFANAEALAATLPNSTVAVRA
jgi:hypothetical protein